jgi:hypothetical protein
VTTSTNRAQSAASARTSIRRRRVQEDNCGVHIDTLGAVAFAAAFKLDGDGQTQPMASPTRSAGSPLQTELSPVRGHAHLSLHRSSRPPVPDPVCDQNRSRHDQRHSKRPTDAVAARALDALKECDAAAFTAIPASLKRRRR